MKKLSTSGVFAAIAIIAACGGTDSAVTYTPDGSVLQDASPDVDTVVIVDAGHDVVVDAPKVANNDVNVPDVNSSIDTGTPETTPIQDVTPTCPTSCTSDSECQSACPGAPSGSANCCDTASGTCFQSTTPVGPGHVGPTDSSMDVYG